MVKIVFDERDMETVEVFVRDLARKNALEYDGASEDDAFIKEEIRALMEERLDAWKRTQQEEAGEAGESEESIRKGSDFRLRRRDPRRGSRTRRETRRTPSESRRRRRRRLPRRTRRTARRTARRNALRRRRRAPRAVSKTTSRSGWGRRLGLGFNRFGASFADPPSGIPLSGMRRRQNVESRARSKPRRRARPPTESGHAPLERPRDEPVLVLREEGTRRRDDRAFAGRRRTGRRLRARSRRSRRRRRRRGGPPRPRPCRRRDPPGRRRRRRRTLARRRCRKKSRNTSSARCRARA